MRRVLVSTVALLLLAVAAPVSAQSPAPSGPQSFEVAPGVTAEGLAFLPGAEEPVVYRLRFEPGSSFDAEGDASVSLVTIESGTMTINTPVDVTVYAPDGTPRTEAAGADATMETGESFLVPPGIGGHLSNDGITPASIVIATLYPTAPGAEQSPDASASPAASAAA